MKCAPQIIGLVRGEPKPGAKHRANGGRIFKEFGNERYTKSETIDRTRSHLNVYEGYKSGGKAWDDICDAADSYRIKGKTKDGKPCERALRSDAVVGYSIIFNPPHGMCKNWTDEEYEKFYDDSWDALCKIQPRLFWWGDDNNMVMTAEHYDEDKDASDGIYTRHVHVGGTAVDRDGRYCGNLIDAKLCADINKNYPRLMRERGWDLEDLDMTDFSRMGKNPDGTYKDPEYRAQREAKKAKSGRSVNKYIADKREADLDRREKSLERKEDIIKSAKTERGAATVALEKAQKALEAANAVLGDKVSQSPEKRQDDAFKAFTEDESHRLTIKTGEGGRKMTLGQIEAFLRSEYRKEQEAKRKAAADAERALQEAQKAKKESYDVAQMEARRRSILAREDIPTLVGIDDDCSYGL